MASLTRRDLTVRISNETNIQQDRVHDIIQRTLNYVAESLVRGQTVEFRNFGVFEVRLRKSRVGRNPNRPEHDVRIPARAIVKFKAGKEMRARVRQLSNSLASQEVAPPPKNGTELPQSGSVP